MSAIYSWLIREGSDEGIEKFDKNLFMPPVGVAKEDMRAAPGWSQDEQASEFMAMMASRAGRGQKGQ